MELRMWRRNALGGCYLVIGWSCLDQLAAEFGMSVISFERFLWRLDFVVGHVSIGKRMGEWSLKGRSKVAAAGVTGFHYPRVVRWSAMPAVDGC